MDHKLKDYRFACRSEEQLGFGRQHRRAGAQRDQRLLEPHGKLREGEYFFYFYISKVNIEYFISIPSQYDQCTDVLSENIALLTERFSS